MSNEKLLNFGELSALRVEILERNDVFVLKKKQLAKFFLQRLLGLDSKTNYSKVEEAYRQSAYSGLEESAKTENSSDFWTNIEKHFLYLKSEPIDAFLQLSLDIINDLKKIDKNLERISSKEKYIEENKKNGRLTAEERYLKKQLTYYKDKNRGARSEIVDFMTNNIQAYAINISSEPPLNSTSLIGFNSIQKPYKFGRRFMWETSDSYDYRNLDEYSNKFGDLYIGDHKELVSLCQESHENFKEVAYYYINGEIDYIDSAREKLERLVRESHILNRRKKIIETMLMHFEKKDFISFVSIAPLQVEGIFADICREVMVSEKELDFSSLNNKLDRLDEKLGRFLYFEYYSFKFPVLRNMIAHGELIDGDFEETALKLMLDLIPVCEFADEKELPTNRHLSILYEASNGRNEKLVEWAWLSKEENPIPDFYDISEQLQLINQHYQSQAFWDYLKNELKKVRSVKEIKRSKPDKIAGLLKCKGIAEQQALEFFKSSTSIVENAIKERERVSALFRRKEK
ncbi:hypothetical protein ACT3TQ_12085 [Halomonas sp. AOP12-C2-37]|uniref:hypothetical protein n=1 Tax=unclassified Halomonas TaxID=2609666 RepID=UPI004034C158